MKKRLNQIIGQSLKKKWAKTAGIIVAVFAFLASIAEFTGINLLDIIGGNSTDTFSVTVLVHGKEGKDDRILRNQGKVVLDFGATREEEQIDNQGEATFKELSNGFIGEKVIISIDHPQPYLPINRDTFYILEKGKSIYLEVELKGIDKILGRVLDFETETPLDSVRVSYQNIATYSDEFGWYELEIPADKQAKFIRVNFLKPGYEMEDIDSIAPHLKQEIGLSLKRKIK